MKWKDARLEVPEKEEACIVLTTKCWKRYPTIETAFYGYDSSTEKMYWYGCKFHDAIEHDQDMISVQYWCYEDEFIFENFKDVELLNPIK